MMENYDGKQLTTMEKDAGQVVASSLVL